MIDISKLDLTELYFASKTVEGQEERKAIKERVAQLVTEMNIDQELAPGYGEAFARGFIDGDIGHD